MVRDVEINGDSVVIEFRAGTFSGTLTSESSAEGILSVFYPGASSRSTNFHKEPVVVRRRNDGTWTYRLKSPPS